METEPELDNVTNTMKMRNQYLEDVKEAQQQKKLKQEEDKK